MGHKPFLKWAGGKYKLTEQINKLLPEGNCLVEPFVGSGSVFLNSNFKKFRLFDINEDLINLYNILKEDITFIDYCFDIYFKNDKYNNAADYLKFRYDFNCMTLENRVLSNKVKYNKYILKNGSLSESELELVQNINKSLEDDINKNVKVKSALFVYFNRYGFNGLCRYSADGMFNVPFGDGKPVYFPRVEMEYFHKKAKSAKFEVADFTKVMTKPSKGDVFYCDPPYAPLKEQKSNFTSYASGGFSSFEQEKLAQLAFKLMENGHPVVISNHDTEKTREWYKIDEHSCVTYTPLRVQRNISSKGSERGKAKELLVLFDKKEES